MEGETMTGILENGLNRRRLLGMMGAGAGVMMLGGCATYEDRVTNVIERLLLLSSERAFARLTAPGGFWDRQVAQIGLDGFLGARGNVLANILTSGLIKARVEREFAGFAVDASERAAPVIFDTIQLIGVRNTIDLITGGPTAATSYLRSQAATRVIDAMVPELGEAMRLAQDPLIGQLLSSLAGVDVGGVASRVAGEVNDTIWTEIGREEAAIRADPRSTNDPVLIGALGVGSRL
ncbi:DUF4197 domain-containing protein [Alteriqipengyuania lutimaris]|uniref:DUF4197 domain-containing protein n=2 Tax=Alteriqipengyuania lutimaris TaxID=1538146 RepID=A0A395LGZ7_9SPHN|nr:DUF4197 domain-containing protein [Alteriqipengyuania lutimaris]